MKFIREWFKKLIIEAVIESLPPVHIYVQERKEEGTLVVVNGGIFNESKIIVAEKSSLRFNRCVIQSNETFIHTQKRKHGIKN